MSVNYTPSALDSNVTLLQSLHRVEKYLKDNPIYKVYAVDASYVVGTSQYDLADVVASESSLAEGDVVFFNNNYYAYVSAVGSEVFSVSNASSFKGDAGSQGIEGPQGPAGADGADGADGKDALMYKYVLEVYSQVVSGSQITLVTSKFNRQPVAGDNFNMWFRNSNTGQMWLGFCSVTISTSSNTVCTVDSSYPCGAKGETGETALVYDKLIEFVYSTDVPFMLNVSIPRTDFNRLPNTNEDFIGILIDTNTGIEYLAQCEIQTISFVGNDLTVTQIVCSYIKRITGQQGPAGADGQNGQDGRDGTNGTNGTNGTDGKDALVYKYIREVTEVPTIGQYMNFNLSGLSRVPEVGNVFNPVIINTATGKTYITTAIITAVSSSYATAQLNAVVNITGASGTTLNKYSFAPSNGLKICDVAKDAKGRLMCYLNISVTIDSKNLTLAMPVNIAFNSAGTACILTGSTNVNDYGTSKDYLINVYLNLNTSSGSVTFALITGVNVTDGTSHTATSYTVNYSSSYMIYWNDTQLH